MKLVFVVLMLLSPLLYGQSKKKYARPALIELKELNEFAELSEERQEMLKVAMAAAKKMRSAKYKFGGSSPEQGGFDCSGAM
ncbi:hypothetical protein N9A94_05205 [Akkermansiaceae bacterium]|nr:hypothetical protein [Akkermansiaceae bacterium]